MIILETLICTGYKVQSTVAKLMSCNYIYNDNPKSHPATRYYTLEHPKLFCLCGLVYVNIFSWCCRMGVH